MISVKKSYIKEPASVTLHEAVDSQNDQNDINVCRDTGKL